LARRVDLRAGERGNLSHRVITRVTSSVSARIASRAFAFIPLAPPRASRRARRARLASRRVPKPDRPPARSIAHRSAHLRGNVHLRSWKRSHDFIPFVSPPRASRARSPSSSRPVEAIAVDPRSPRVDRRASRFSRRSRARFYPRARDGDAIERANIFVALMRRARDAP
jgi:hypothetical protein